jgi:DNA-binding NarL/FixJ family response regulator
MIEVYFKSKFVKSWINSIETELEKITVFNFHSTLESLKNELDIKIKKTIAIIDLTDSSFSLYTKNYFGSSKNIKFIGVGTKLELSDLKKITESNIESFIEVGASAIELIKAVKHLNNDRKYFCEQTKEQIIFELIKHIENAKHDNILFNSINSNELNNANNTKDSLELNVMSLTEKEKKVTQLLTQGLSYKEIANILGVTSFAINQNAKNIFKKLKVRSRSELSFRIFN